MPGFKGLFQSNPLPFGLCRYSSLRNDLCCPDFLVKEETEKAADEQIRATRLYEAYKEWCQEQGEETMTQTQFGVEMKSRGYQKRMYRYVYYIGLKLKK
jgi:hypothetical protein